MIAATLARLLATTPFPPQDDDIDVLLAAFAEVARGRQAIIDELSALGTSPEAAREATDPTMRSDVNELVARELAWEIALAAARQRLAAQRIGIGQLRGYASMAGDR